MPRKLPSRPRDASEWRTPSGGAATDAFYQAIHEDVTRWWRANQRTDLPWRAAASSSSSSSAGASGQPAQSTPLYNPYEVWVSEVMSQQTRMETVIPYYRRWMHKYPTIDSLAASSEAEVKAVWAGMGYYRRALYLHKGAQYLQEWRRGQLASAAAAATAVPVMPTTQQELVKVPGIGPYTSAAIASQCYGEAVCSVDGNVIRVLSRLRGERGFDPKLPANVKRAWTWGQELMGNTPQTGGAVCRDPSALNQGLMEIGASVCRPNAAPLCAACPLQRHCCAYALQQAGVIAAIEGVIPTRAAVAAKRSAKEVCVVHEVRDDGEGADDGLRRFVVVRRPPAGLLAGMLEFPTVRAAAVGDEDDADGDGALPSHPLATLPTLRKSAAARSVRSCGSLRHIFSHIVMDVAVLQVCWPAKTDTGKLMTAIAAVLDDHNDGEGSSPSPAAARMSLMTEAELREAAPSRLMLKVLHQLSATEVKRKRSPTREAKTPLPKRSSSSRASTGAARRKPPSP